MMVRTETRQQTQYSSQDAANRRGTEMILEGGGGPSCSRVSAITTTVSQPGTCRACQILVPSLPSCTLLQPLSRNLLHLLFQFSPARSPLPPFSSLLLSSVPLDSSRSLSLCVFRSVSCLASTNPCFFQTVTNLTAPLTTPVRHGALYFFICSLLIIFLCGVVPYVRIVRMYSKYILKNNGRRQEAVLLCTPPG